MKPHEYRIQENAAYKLSRHQLAHERHNHQRHGSHSRTTDAAFKTAHLVQLAGILTPVVVAHFVKEPEKQWRAVRLASLITAVLTGGIWEAHNYQQKHHKKHHEGGDWVDRISDVLGPNGTQLGPSV